MSSSRRKVAAYASDGTEVIWETAANWSVAGLVKYSADRWGSPLAGHSDNSVRSRTITHARRYGFDTRTVETAAIWDTTVPGVREYFGSHRVTVESAFFPDRGWVEGKYRRMRAGRKQIRQLAAEGVTAVALRCHGNNRTADFQMPELTESLKRRVAA